MEEEEPEMTDTRYDTITREDLAARLERGAPNNEDRSAGFALVNVLEPEQFERERIPGSANIPRGREDAFEQRFDKDKEIIVYCASPECDASEKAARELTRRGFQRVVEYPDGLADWRDAGRTIVGTASGAFPRPTRGRAQ
jgi:rhodanese-related sulfurtransferase